MKIYKYNNYNDYVSAQIEANKQKINNVWVRETTIKKIKEYKPNAPNILCHGTRNAKEQIFFNKYFDGSNIIGTEISDTATQFPMTVQHDFHKNRPEWVGRFDIVYSNSWDHSYDPEKSLTTWKNQLNDDGLLFLEQATDPSDNRSRVSDPLEISHEETLELIKEIGTKLVGTFDSTGPGRHHPSIIYVIKKVM